MKGISSGWEDCTFRILHSGYSKEDQTVGRVLVKRRRLLFVAGVGVPPPPPRGNPKSVAVIGAGGTEFILRHLADGGPEYRRASCHDQQPRKCSQAEAIVGRRAISGPHYEAHGGLAFYKFESATNSPCAASATASGVPYQRLQRIRKHYQSIAEG